MRAAPTSHGRKPVDAFHVTRRGWTGGRAVRSPAGTRRAHLRLFVTILLCPDQAPTPRYRCRRWAERATIAEPISGDRYSVAGTDHIE